MPDSKIGSSSLHVDVHDVKGGIIKDATVTFRSARPVRDKEFSARFDSKTGHYVAHDVPMGEGILEVKHGALQSQTRKVYAGAGQHTELFILGKPGAKTFFREKVEVPVDADGDLIGVTMQRKARSSNALVDRSEERRVGKECRL